MASTASKSFRRTFLLLILFLWTVFNLERLQYAAGLEVVGIHNFVYLMMLLVITKIIYLPPSSRASEWMHLLFTLLIYLVARLTAFSDGGVFGGTQTFVTITELLILGLTVTIISRMMEHFSGLEAILDEVFIPSRDNRVVQTDKAKFEIDKEISRCRRYSHSLTVLAVKAQPGQSSVDTSVLMDEMRQYGLNRFVGASVARMLAEQTRRSDTIIRGKGRDYSYVVLCPETTPQGSEMLAERIKQTASRSGIDLTYGIASFPDEAVTYEELVQAAERKMGKPPVIGQARLSDHIQEGCDAVRGTG